MKDGKLQEITLSLPYPTSQTILMEHIKRFKNSIFLFFSRITDFGIGLKHKFSQSNPGSGNIYGKVKRPIKKFIPILILIIFVLPVILLTASKILMSNNMRVQGLSTQNTQDNQPQLDIKAKNFSKKELTFPVKNGSGVKVSEFKYSIESAELLNEIYIKGQKASALKDKLFLIVNIKLTNDQKQGLSINGRDYIRLSVNSKSEWLAPDIHNDPVEIQAISTKYTRVGFVVNTSDANPVLQIGEIDGGKQKIELKFK